MDTLYRLTHDSVIQVISYVSIFVEWKFVYVEFKLNWLCIAE